MQHHAVRPRSQTSERTPPAKELYKQSINVELFFRWVKQTLEKSGNAVCIQIALVLIAFLLLRLAQAALRAMPVSSPSHGSPRSNLMHWRRLDRMHNPHSRPPVYRVQLVRSLDHA
jgi:hypothetical protein